jgi:hypothetical protein
MTEDRAPRHRRPSMPGARHFDALVGDVDPAVRSEAADRSAALLVRGPRSPEETAVVERIVALADTEGLEEIAEVWAGSAPESLAGSLWRLFLLRSWVYADPLGAARQFDAGRRHSQVMEVVAGVTSPPGPDEVRTLADQVLRGIRQGDYADTLFRAAAFAHLAAIGRAHLADGVDAAEPGPHDLSAARLMTLAQQLESAGRQELSGGLA